MLSGIGQRKTHCLISHVKSKNFKLTVAESRMMVVKGLEVGQTRRRCKKCKLSGFSFFLFNIFLGLHLWHMEVPRLGVKLELQLLAYTTAQQ